MRIRPDLSVHVEAREAIADVLCDRSACSCAEDATSGALRRCRCTFAEGGAVMTIPSEISDFPFEPWKFTEMKRYSRDISAGTISAKDTPVEIVLPAMRRTSR